MSKPRSRKKESSRSLGGRVKTQPFPDVSRRRRSRSANALIRSCASDADEETSMTSRPRFRKQESSRSLGGRVTSQPSSDVFRRRRSRSAGALTRSCASTANEENSRMSSPRCRKNESSRSLGGRVKNQPFPNAFRRRRSRPVGALTRSCASVTDEDSSSISRPRTRKNKSSTSLVDRDKGRTFRKRSSRPVCAPTISCVSVADKESSLIYKYRSREQESKISLSSFSTKAFQCRRSRPAGALTRS